MLSCLRLIFKIYYLIFKINSQKNSVNFLRKYFILIYFLKINTQFFLLNSVWEIMVYNKKII